MAVIEVRLGERSYPVTVAPGCLDEVGPWLLAGRGHRQVHVVSQMAVWRHHGAALAAGLAAAGLWEPGLAPTLAPDGEEAKSWTVAGRLLDDLVERGLERGDAVVALGGGVVGDLAGFAAATYLRGIAFVQAPTTLLAQVDASVGGKTGINHPRGKNLIGAFHQPSAVFADTAALGTLPLAELRAGLAECVKHGMIASGDYLAEVEARLPALLGGDPAALAEIVAGSVRIKAAVVGEDEREEGRRAILNFGHTAAHALEAVAQFGWRHGEAVAAGMVVAARLANELGLADASLTERLQELLRTAGLPVRLPAVPAEALLAAAGQDKKRRQGRLTWVLVASPGDATLRQDVPEALVLQVLRELGAA